MDILIKKVTVGKWKVNCYLISCENEAWIIDPGDDAETIVRCLNLDSYDLKGIVNTHSHFDHIGAVAEIKERYNIPFYLHSQDKRLTTQGNLYRRMVGDTIICKTPIIDNYLDDLPFLNLKGNKILIHHTPGHTNGGVCFEINKNLFAGDMLLESNSTISNLPGVNSGLMEVSLDFIFKKFKGFLVNPGHGKSFILNDNLICKFKLLI
jgi:hydroxyacylglutathione hydrolase